LKNSYLNKNDSECKKTFSQKSALYRHKRESCPYRASGSGMRKRKAPTQLKAQAKKTKVETSVPKINLSRCKDCNSWYNKNNLSSHLRSLNHKSAIGNEHSDNVKIITTAFKSRIISFMLLPNKVHVDISDFFDEVKDNFVKVLTEQITSHQVLKVNVELFGQYISQVDETINTKSFNTQNKVITVSTNLNEIYNNFSVGNKRKSFNIYPKWFSLDVTKNLTSGD
jgi:hypothetical protein